MNNDRRYFDKDLEQFILDYNLKGYHQEVHLKWDEYGKTDMFAPFLLVFTARELVLIPQRPSLFSYEFLPLGMKYLAYSLFKTANITIMDIESVNLLNSEYTKEFILEHERVFILHLTTFTDNIIEIVVYKFELLAEFEKKMGKPILIK